MINIIITNYYFDGYHANGEYKWLRPPLNCVSKNTFIYCWPEEPPDFSQWLPGKFILLDQKISLIVRAWYSRIHILACRRDLNSFAFFSRIEASMGQAWGKHEVKGWSYYLHSYPVRDLCSPSTYVHLPEKCNKSCQLCQLKLLKFSSWDKLIRRKKCKHKNEVLNSYPNLFICLTLFHWS